MRDDDDDDEQGKIGLLSQWTPGRLSLAIFKTLKKEEDWKKYLEVALASHKKLPHLKPTRALDKAGRKLTAQLTTAGGGRPLI